MSSLEVFVLFCFVREVLGAVPPQTGGRQLDCLTQFSVKAEPAENVTTLVPNRTQSTRQSGMKTPLFYHQHLETNEISK